MSKISKNTISIIGAVLIGVLILYVGGPGNLFHSPAKSTPELRQKCIDDMKLNHVTDDASLKRCDDAQFAKQITASDAARVSPSN